MCPFLDKSDARCATHLTLANLTCAFTHCADQYVLCPVHQRLMAELLSNDHVYEESAAAVGLVAAT